MLKKVVLLIVIMMGQVACTSVGVPFSEVAEEMERVPEGMTRVVMFRPDKLLGGGQIPVFPETNTQNIQTECEVLNNGMFWFDMSSSDLNLRYVIYDGYNNVQESFSVKNRFNIKLFFVEVLPNHQRPKRNNPFTPPTPAGALTAGLMDLTNRWAVSSVRDENLAAIAQAPQPGLLAFRYLTKEEALPKIAKLRYVPCKNY
jgi:hypothetical protein